MTFEDEMAEEQPTHVSYLRQAKDLAIGVHPWSKYVPPLLLLADALLTSLIIYKVACKPLNVLYTSTSKLILNCRHRN